MFCDTISHLRSTVSKKKIFFFEIFINLIIFLDSAWVIYRAKCKQFGGNRGLEPFTGPQSSIF